MNIITISREFGSEIKILVPAIGEYAKIWFQQKQ